MDLVELVHHQKVKNLSEAWLSLLRSYFRVELEGIENLPAAGSGGAVIAPNHSGYAGTDAILLANLIRKQTTRRPRIMAHRAFFDFSQTIKQVSESYGMKKASVAQGTEILRRKHLLMVFPEGERGNFKPTYQAYRLQLFHTGFLRMAIQAQTPIIPTLVIGAEESHLNIGNLDLSKMVKGLRIPLPLNLVPLPAKWKIRFLKPLRTDLMDPAILDDRARLEAMARDIQEQMQWLIDEELKKRPYVYFRRARALLDKARAVKTTALGRPRSAVKDDWSERWLDD